MAEIVEDLEVALQLFQSITRNLELGVELEIEASDAQIVLQSAIGLPQSQQKKFSQQKVQSIHGSTRTHRSY